MRVVVQRVTEASVSTKDGVVGAIGKGLLVFVAFQRDDCAEEITWLRHKLPQLRCYEDADGKLNASVASVSGAFLLVSQFTLFGSLRKGNRPSFNRSAAPEDARSLFEAFARDLAAESGLQVETGAFRNYMTVRAVNDGPVTLIIDSRNRDV